MKAQQGVDQRRLACPIRTKQADRAPIQSAVQRLKDRTLAEGNAQVVEFDDCAHSVVILHAKTDGRVGRPPVNLSECVSSNHSLFFTSLLSIAFIKMCCISKEFGRPIRLAGLNPKAPPSVLAAMVMRSP